MLKEEEYTKYTMSVNEAFTIIFAELKTRAFDNPLFDNASAPFIKVQGPIVVNDLFPFMVKTNPVVKEAKSKFATEGSGPLSIATTYFICSIQNG